MNGRYLDDSFVGTPSPAAVTDAIDFDGSLFSRNRCNLNWLNLREQTVEERIVPIGGMYPREIRDHGISTLAPSTVNRIDLAGSSFNVIMQKVIRIRAKTKANTCTYISGFFSQVFRLTAKRGSLASLIPSAKIRSRDCAT